MAITESKTSTMLTTLMKLSWRPSMFFFVMDASEVDYNVLTIYGNKRLAILKTKIRESCSNSGRFRYVHFRTNTHRKSMNTSFPPR